MQRLRDAESDRTFGEFSGTEGDLVSGVIQQGSDPRVVRDDLGKVEAVLTPSEQVPGESYPHGTRIKCVVTGVRKGPRGPQVTVSRSHPALVRGLFALEVPEIADGLVEVLFRDGTGHSEEDNPTLNVRQLVVVPGAVCPHELDAEAAVDVPEVAGITGGSVEMDVEGLLERHRRVFERYKADLDDEEPELILGLRRGEGGAVANGAVLRVVRGAVAAGDHRDLTTTGGDPRHALQLRSRGDGKRMTLRRNKIAYGEQSRFGWNKIYSLEITNIRETIAYGEQSRFGWKARGDPP